MTLINLNWRILRYLLFWNRWIQIVPNSVGLRYMQSNCFRCLFADNMLLDDLCMFKLRAWEMTTWFAVERILIRRVKLVIPIKVNIHHIPTEIVVINAFFSPSNLRVSISFFLQFIFCSRLEPVRRRSVSFRHWSVGWFACVFPVHETSQRSAHQDYSHAIHSTHLDFPLSGHKGYM